MQKPEILMSMERPTEVHKHPCVHCPSEWHEPDPEAVDILEACVKGDITERDFLFSCGWRSNKLCRGLWNRLQEKKFEGEKDGLKPNDGDLSLCVGRSNS